MNLIELFSLFQKLPPYIQLGLLILVALLSVLVLVLLALVPGYGVALAALLAALGLTSRQRHPRP
jgi:hypothetical protein